MVYVPVRQEQLKNLKDQKRDTWFLYFTMITGILTWLSGGSSIVWPSPAIVKLKSNVTAENPLGKPITTLEISMLLGTQSAVSLLGSALLPKLADILGRKRCIHLMGSAMFLSMLALAFSDNINQIIIFYTLTASFFAGIMGVLPMYMTEICEDHNRAKYGCLMAVCLPLGQLYTFLIGPLLSIQWYTLLLAAPLIPFMALFFLVPESPVFLLKNEKENECMLAIRKLRSNKIDEELEKDFLCIKSGLDANVQYGNTFTKLFNTKEGRIGVLLALIPMCTQFLSGMPVILPLLAPIFNESGSNMSGNNIAICVGATKLTCYFLTFLVVEKVGRKPLLLLSSIGAGISIFILGSFFYLKHINYSLITQMHWIPLISILSFIVFFSLGLGLIPLGMISVMFTVELRSTATSFVITTTYSLVALYLALYPLVSEAIGIYWCMWLFATTSFVGSFLMYMFLPETKGKSIEEIQDILKKM
ncbi:facilitated trehalose transporter Tret1-like [Diabrotica undecimpunctata]|uniref:facilitated trehalose transporter Tret1-like n=1 Tax=Diabrotica undecimpunctata TaxID=50387 RepID=UPI003B63ED50